MSDFNLLTIDYGDPNAPDRFVRSLRETGFAVLGGHPITKQRIEAAYAAWGAFFDSSDKHHYLRDPETQAGYFPYLSENAKGHAQKDLKEFYHVYQTGPVPKALEEDIRQFHADLVALGTTLLRWIQDRAPSAVQRRFSEPLPDMIKGSSKNLLRVLHYPPVEEAEIEPGAVRAAAHEDINLITLLVAGSAPGLQAKDASGRWHEVSCDAGMITVNAGDMLWKASGEYFPSTTHRVVNPDAEYLSRSRYSMPLFLHPREEVVLNESYTAGSYLSERLRQIGLKG